MRHSKIETTLEYSHLRMHELQEAMAKLSLVNDK